MSILDNSTVLITGGSGSWGQTLTSILLNDYNVKKIICFSRGELAQVTMQRKFRDDRIKYVIGDVRDYEAVKFATKNVDYIFHMAALKHVPVCEDHPQEAIKTNITGTTNIVNAAIENNVKKVIDVSTDKAVDPLNLYGMTKAVGEKIIIQGNELSDVTKFVCVRGGNVLGSNGSVVPYFIQQIKSNGPLTVTDKSMTRFFLTLEEAIRLVLKAAECSIGGETFVMNMPSFKITDVADVLMDRYGHVPVTEIGSKPGEKRHELLISEHEAEMSYCFDDAYYVILPTKFFDSLYPTYRNLTKFPYKRFASDTELSDSDVLVKLLRKGNFI